MGAGLQVVAGGALPGAAHVQSWYPSSCGVGYNQSRDQEGDCKTGVCTKGTSSRGHGEKQQRPPAQRQWLCRGVWQRSVGQAVEGITEGSDPPVAQWQQG